MRPLANIVVSESTSDTVKLRKKAPKPFALVYIRVFARCWPPPALFPPTISLYARAVLPRLSLRWLQPFPPVLGEYMRLFLVLQLLLTQVVWRARRRMMRGKEIGLRSI